MPEDREGVVAAWGDAATVVPWTLHERFGVQSSTRASSYLYTTTSEIDVLVDALNHTVGFFSRPARTRPARERRTTTEGGAR